MSLSNPGRRFGRLIITTCRQSGGHPWVDQATTRDEEGRRRRADAERGYEAMFRHSPSEARPGHELY